MVNTVPITRLLFLPESILTQEQASPEPKDPTLVEIERLYQQFSFEAPTPEVRVKNQTVAVTSSQLPLVPSLRDKLQQSLLGVADNLLHCYSPDVSSGCRCCFSN